ncbi:hypothetical protein JKP88DRAFT_248192 [Tribonema minus]|uniref:Uncharacterized protein n=1 Tax=Tribonema minus TaxID=303371 RepID=A0A835YRH3_9STRA|nr:hypothetical protein JKP88DRAFT_248192 [Tribonema minus]
MPVDAVRRNADGSRLHLLLQALQQSSSTEQEQQAPASSPPPPPPPPPRCVGRKRAWDGTAFGPWETLVAPPAGSKGPGKCPSVMINLNRGGRILFWPGLVDEARRKILHEAVQNCIYQKQAAQMRELWGEDTKAHRYHGLCMRCQPISTFPGEIRVVCVVVQAYQARPLHFRPKLSVADGGRPLEVGDEEVQLFPQQGDAYDFDGASQRTAATINLKRGGRILFWPEVMSHDSCALLRDTIGRCTGYRECASGMYVQPKGARVPRGDAAANRSYLYSGLCLRCQPIVAYPEMEQLKRKAEQSFGETFNLDVDVLVYRDGDDSYCWRSDNAQGETRVMCFVVEAYSTRPVLFRPKQSVADGGHPLEVGDEEIQLLPLQGDAYDFDGASQCPSVMINLNRGGRILFWPGLVEEERRRQLQEAMLRCAAYRQYTFGMYLEPRVHVLLGDDTTKGYLYHGVSLQCQPIRDFPCKPLQMRAERWLFVRLLENAHPRLMAALQQRRYMRQYPDAVRQSSSSCGEIIAYAVEVDFGSGETLVVCLVVESEEARPLHFRPKLCVADGGRPLEVGDEEVQLFPQQGDAYDFDGASQTGMPCSGAARLLRAHEVGVGGAPLRMHFKRGAHSPCCGACPYDAQQALRVRNNAPRALRCAHRLRVRVQQALNALKLSQQRSAQSLSFKKG